MKRIFFLFLAASLAALLLSGCDLFQSDPPDEAVEMTAAAIPIVKIDATMDTLTNAETETWTLVTVNGPAEYEFGIAADSISGSTAATCYLYQYMDFGSTYKYILETIVVNGVSTRTREVGTLVGGVLTCACTSTGTQVTHVRPDLNLVPRTPQ